MTKATRHITDSYQNRLAAYTLGVAGISAASSGVAYGIPMDITANLPALWRAGLAAPDIYGHSSFSLPGGGGISIGGRFNGYGTFLFNSFSGARIMGSGPNYYGGTFLYTAGAIFGPGSPEKQAAHFINYGGTVSPQFTSDVSGGILGFRDATGHYGYLVINWEVAFLRVTVTGGFIESEANTAIVAASPTNPVPDTGSSLMLLSLGSAGLIALRRKLKAA